MGGYGGWGDTVGGGIRWVGGYGGWGVTVGKFFRNFQTETVLLSVAVPSLLFRLQESPRAQSFL